MIELHLLRYVLAAADTGSFSRAADRFGIKQSTLSKRVQYLELRPSLPASIISQRLRLAPTMAPGKQHAILSERDLRVIFADQAADLRDKQVAAGRAVINILRHLRRDRGPAEIARQWRAEIRNLRIVLGRAGKAVAGGAVVGLIELGRSLWRDGPKRVDRRTADVGGDVAGERRGTEARSAMPDDPCLDYDPTRRGGSPAHERGAAVSPQAPGAAATPSRVAAQNWREPPTA